MGKSAGIRIVIAVLGMASAGGAWGQQTPAAEPIGPQTAVGDLFGEKTSRGAVRAFLRRIGERTGAAPTLVGGMTSRDGRTTEAVCTFAARGQACKALILSDSDANRTVVFMDRADTFDRNYPEMMRKFLASTPRPDEPWKLEQRRLNDGSTISLPPTWRVTGDNQGMISAKGPEGAIDYGCATQVFATSYRRGVGRLTQGVLFADAGDPSKVHQDLFPQIAALAQQFGEPESRFVKMLDKAAIKNPVGSCEVLDYEWDSLPNGKTVRWRSVALVITAPMGDSQMYYLSAVHAPAQSFPRHLRELLRIWASCAVSARTQADRLAQAAANLKQVGDIIRGVHEARTKAVEDSLKNWSAAFREENFARDNQTGTVTAGRVSGGRDFQKVIDAANQGAGWKRFEVLDPKEVE